MIEARREPVGAESFWGIGVAAGSRERDTRQANGVTQLEAQGPSDESLDEHEEYCNRAKTVAGAFKTDADHPTLSQVD